MAVVFAAIDFEEPGRAVRVAERLAADAGTYPDLLSEPLLDSGFVVASHMVPRRAHDVGRLTVTRPDEQTVLVGGPKRSHEEGAAVARELASPGSATDELPYGRWIAFRHDPVARTVRVLNDPLGMAWLYLAKVAAAT